MDRAQIPSTMGLQAPTRANVGKASSNGFEVTLDYSQDFSNDLFIGARANFSLLIVNMSSMKSWIIPVLDYLGDQELD